MCDNKLLLLLLLLPVPVHYNYTRLHLTSKKITMKLEKKESVFLWFCMRDTGTGTQVVASSVTMGSPWMVTLGAELVPRRPGQSHLLMALLHEDEFLSHSLHLLFQVCRDNGQIIQGLSEALDFNFQLFLKGVFIFKPLVREVGLEHSCCWKAVGLAGVHLG